jgi:hypothetical protein
MKMKTKGAIKSKEEEEKRGGAALRYRHWMDFAQEKNNEIFEIYKSYDMNIYIVRTRETK